MMDPNEWKHEMNRMLDSFASRAEYSLTKINRCFETLGQPFDDDFRKYYLEMSNQRLDMSFKSVLFSKGRGNEAKSGTNDVSFTQKQSLNSFKNENDGDLIEVCDSDDDNHSDTRPDQNADDVKNGIACGQSSEAKPIVQAGPGRGNEDNRGGMIEIYDSDDDGGQFEAQTFSDMNESHTVMIETGTSAMHGIPIRNRHDTQSHSAELDSENEVKPFVKVEPIADGAIETADIPLERFDPNKENDRTVAVNEKSENIAAQQTGSSSKRNQSESSVEDKRFECEHCDRVFKTKQHYVEHGRVHANGKLIGIKADSNGLYHCSHCVRRFIHVGYLSKHMKSHKHGQSLFYCTRCMRQFTQKVKKESHEIQCEGRHFECHLCKVYATSRKAQMQYHMRTHSGARPFQCMICNKYFQYRYGLRKHLNSIHSRK